MNQAKHSAEHDLQHFLRLAAAQVRHRLTQVEANRPYSVQAAKLRLLEELIKEQISNENFNSSTCAPR